PISSDQHTRTNRGRPRRRHHRDQRAPLPLARQPRKLALDTQGSYLSTKTSISPPQGSPTSHASESAMPKCSSRGPAPARISSATSTTAPSTQPPDTAPTTSPWSLIAIFEPGGSGADLRVSITVASATLFPRSDHLCACASTSLIVPPHQMQPGFRCLPIVLS